MIFWLFAKSFSMDGPLLDPSSVGPKTIARLAEPILLASNFVEWKKKVNQRQSAYLVVQPPPIGRRI